MSNEKRPDNWRTGYDRGFFAGGAGIWQPVSKPPTAGNSDREHDKSQDQKRSSGRNQTRSPDRKPSKSPSASSQRSSSDASSSSKRTSTEKPTEKFTSFFCDFCKMEITTQKSYDLHFQSGTHLQKESLFRKAFDDNLHFCYTCERIFPSKIELDAHCLMGRHQPLYRVEEVHSLRAQLSKKAIKPDQPVSVVPTKKPNKDDTRRSNDKKDRDVIVTKLSGMRNEKELKEKEKEPAEENKEPKKWSSSGFSEAASDDKFYCDVCEVDLLNASNQKVHLDSWRHRAMKDKKREEVEEAKKHANLITPQDEEETEEDVKSKESKEYLKLETVGLKVPANLRGKVDYSCNVCSIPIESEEAYYKHAQSVKHLRQVSQMKPPFKCYNCNCIFTVEKDFSSHLASEDHVSVAFGKTKKSPSEGDQRRVEIKDYKEKQPGKPRNEHDNISKEKDTRKVSEKNEHRSTTSKEKQESPHSDNKRSSSQDTKRTDGREIEAAALHKVEKGDQRKVEFLPAENDLRNKLKRGDSLKVNVKVKDNIVITKERTPEPAPPAKINALPETPPAKESPVVSTDQRNENDKKAKELELEAKLRKLSKEYADDLHGLKKKLTAEREADILGYQASETKYQRLCDEEDAIRERLRTVREDDPKKENLIRDMIRLQSEMRDVRGELELREIMIIKRESLFREKFPDSDDRQVLIREPEAPLLEPALLKEGPLIPESSKSLPVKSAVPEGPVIPKTSSRASRKSDEARGSSKQVKERAERLPQDRTSGRERPLQDNPPARERPSHDNLSGSSKRLRPSIERSSSYKEADKDFRSSQPLDKRPDSRQDYGPMLPKQHESVHAPNASAASEIAEDARVKLERERLLMRLGPELQAIDPSIREKLLAAIFDKESISQSPQFVGAGSNVDASKSTNQELEKLAKREDQLEKELQKLRQSKDSKKKSVKGSQHDAEKKKIKSKRKKEKSATESSSSYSDTDSESETEKPQRGKKKVRERKTKREDSASSNERSSSKKKKKATSVKKAAKKVTKKKTVKLNIKKKPVAKKIDQVKNPLPGSEHSHSEDDSPGKPAKENNPIPGSIQGNIAIVENNAIEVIGGVPILNAKDIPVDMPMSRNDTTPSVEVSSKARSTLEIRKEQFNMWNKPTVVASPSLDSKNNSPKQDEWEMAFGMGGRSEEHSANAKAREEEQTIFDPKAEVPSALTGEIWKILRNAVDHPIAQASIPHQAHKVPPPPITATSSIHGDNQSAIEQVRNILNINRDAAAPPEVTYHPEPPTVLSAPVRSEFKPSSNLPFPSQPPVMAIASQSSIQSAQDVLLAKLNPAAYVASILAGHQTVPNVTPSILPNVQPPMSSFNLTPELLAHHLDRGRMTSTLAQLPTASAVLQPPTSDQSVLNIYLQSLAEKRASEGLPMDQTLASMVSQPPQASPVDWRVQQMSGQSSPHVSDSASLTGSLDTTSGFGKRLAPRNTDERLPVREPGETDQAFYKRFERFYEAKKRMESLQYVEKDMMFRHEAELRRMAVPPYESSLKSPLELKSSRTKPTADIMSSESRDQFAGMNREREELMKQLELERAEREKLIKLEQKRLMEAQERELREKPISENSREEDRRRAHPTPVDKREQSHLKRESGRPESRNRDHRDEGRSERERSGYRGDERPRDEEVAERRSGQKKRSHHADKDGRELPKKSKETEEPKTDKVKASNPALKVHEKKEVGPDNTLDQNLPALHQKESENASVSEEKIPEHSTGDQKEATTQEKSVNVQPPADEKQTIDLTEDEEEQESTVRNGSEVDSISAALKEAVNEKKDVSSDSRYRFPPAVDVKSKLTAPRKEASPKTAQLEASEKTRIEDILKNANRILESAYSRQTIDSATKDVPPPPPPPRRPILKERSRQANNDGAQEASWESWSKRPLLEHPKEIPNTSDPESRPVDPRARGDDDAFRGRQQPPKDVHPPADRVPFLDDSTDDVREAVKKIEKAIMSPPNLDINARSHSLSRPVSRPFTPPSREEVERLPVSHPGQIADPQNRGLYIEPTHKHTHAADWKPSHHTNREPPLPVKDYGQALYPSSQNHNFPLASDRNQAPVEDRNPVPYSRSQPRYAADLSHSSHRDEPPRVASERGLPQREIGRGMPQRDAYQIDHRGVPPSEHPQPRGLTSPPYDYRPAPRPAATVHEYLPEKHMAPPPRQHMPPPGIQPPVRYAQAPPMSSSVPPQQPPMNHYSHGRYGGYY